MPGSDKTGNHFMTEYRVNKAELHALLKALGILQQDEQLMLVNNIELRDPKAEMLSIIVDTVKNGNMYRSEFEELTEKELVPTNRFGKNRIYRPALNFRWY